MFFFIVQSFPLVLNHHLCVCPEIHAVLKKLCCRINVLRVMHFCFHHTNELFCLIQYIAIFINLIVVPIIKIIMLIPFPWSNLSSTIRLCIVKHAITMCCIFTSSHFSIGFTNKNDIYSGQLQMLSQPPSCPLLANQQIGSLSLSMELK